MYVLSEKNIQVVNLDLTTQENKDRVWLFDKNENNNEKKNTCKS